MNPYRRLIDRKITHSINVLLVTFCLSSLCHAQWRFDWASRLDQQGKPAGIFDITPFPISETSLTYSVTNDEGTKTFALGAIYFVDNSPGIVNATTTYNPATRSNTGARYTCYTSLVNAFAAHSDTVNGQNITLLVRDGTYVGNYTVTNHFGVDDTHRYSVIGYKQERPVLTGTGSTSMILGGNSQPFAYFTLQRLKLANNLGEGVYIGYDVVGQKRAQYVSLIDCWFYQCAYAADSFTGTNSGTSTTVMTDSGSPGWTTNQWTDYYLMNATKQAADTGTVYYAKITTNTPNTMTTAAMPAAWVPGDSYYVAALVNGSVYYMNADHGWIYHCTMERSHGHGIKVGDGSAHMTEEWNYVYHAGWWPGLAYHMSRTVGFDFPNDAGKDEMHNNVCRYNILDGCLSHGMQVRGVLGMVAHHNEITNWGNMYANVGYIGGVTTSGLTVLTTNPCSGSFYDNIVHDPAPAAVGTMISDGRTDLTFTYYNNLLYWSSNNTSGPYSYDFGPTHGTSFWYNNTIYGSTSLYAFRTGTTAGRTGDIIRGNVIYQAGTGQTWSLNTATTHDHNLLYCPSGTLGNAKDATDINANPVFVSTPAGTYAWGMGNIRATSPAKDAFPTASAPTRIFAVDFNNTPRPIGAAWDIGAYEYNEDSITQPSNAVPKITVH